MERYLAIDNVCAWPNLTLLPDGSVVAVIFNQPCHGAWEGDLECWGSVDGGRQWSRRGVAAAHEPGTNRMNVAAGLAANGDLVVLASGWSDRPRYGEIGQAFADSSILPAWICRSADGGHTWRRGDLTLPAPDLPEAGPMIPFGDILPGHDGALYAVAYCATPDKRNSALLLRSADDGLSWAVHGTLGADDYNETAILHLGDGRWLAAARTARQQQLELRRSHDGGATWRSEQILSLTRQIPAHLLRLADGRLLLSYGMRSPNQMGVGARISTDEGQTWGVPVMIAPFSDGDGGYPSTVQLPDGKLLTAYYCARQPLHGRYHMGVVIWEPEEMAKRWH